MPATKIRSVLRYLGWALATTNPILCVIRSAPWR
jgi:hypothetical protein